MDLVEVSIALSAASGSITPIPNDPPQEPLMRIVCLLSLKSLQLFMVEEGLHAQIVVHPQGLELLGQRKVCEDHVMDLSHVKLVFNQTEDRFVHCCLLTRRVVPSRPPRTRPGNSVQTIG